MLQTLDFALFEIAMALDFEQKMKIPQCKSESALLPASARKSGEYSHTAFVSPLNKSYSKETSKSRRANVKKAD